MTISKARSIGCSMMTTRRGIESWSGQDNNILNNPFFIFQATNEKYLTIIFTML